MKYRRPSTILDSVLKGRIIFYKQSFIKMNWSFSEYKACCILQQKISVTDALEELRVAGRKSLSRANIAFVLSSTKRKIIKRTTSRRYFFFKSVGYRICFPGKTGVFALDKAQTRRVCPIVLQGLRYELRLY